jgi:hypothetical protein
MWDWSVTDRIIWKVLSSTAKSLQVANNKNIFDMLETAR